MWGWAGRVVVYLLHKLLAYAYKPAVRLIGAAARRVGAASLAAACAKAVERLTKAISGLQFVLSVHARRAALEWRGNDCVFDHAVLEEGGHHCHLTRPAEVAEVMGRWLAATASDSSKVAGADPE